MKGRVVSALLAGALVLLASSAAVAQAPQRQAPQLLDLSVTSGRPFAGDRTLLATVSPNGDGLRDRAVVRFRLDRRARVALYVFVCGKHPRVIRTIRRRLGPGWHHLVWAPQPNVVARTYLLRMVLRGNGLRRSYGSLFHPSARIDSAPVVRVLGISATFTRQSYAPGAVARLRIATDEPNFTLQLYQAGPEAQDTTGDGMEGVPVGPPRVVDWSAHRDAPATLSVQLGPDWPNGIYFARLNAPDERSYFAPLLIRPARWGLHRIAVVVHTNTWQAYNFEDVNGDGWGDTWYASDDIRTVDLSRAYVGLGAPPRWRKYDLPFLHWLYRTGKGVDFLTDDDLRRFSGPRDLARLYDLIVFPGYDEYETRHVYDLVAGYRNRGGNLIFLSATNFLWKVERHGGRITRIAQWRQLGRPEARLVGVEYEGNDEGQHHGHYVLSSFGRDSWALAGVDPAALGAWRWFGIEYDMTTRASPRGIHVLARVNPHMPNRRLRGDMTYYQRGGAKVFAAGTLNFPAGLVYPQFRRLLENVWDRLSVP